MSRYKIIFAHWDSNFHNGFMNSSKAKYFLEKGHTVEYIRGKYTAEEWIDKLKDGDHVFLYNGSRPESKPYVEAANHLNKTVSYYEGGILPARGHEYVDRNGILGNSSLCKDISWVTDEMLEETIRWRSWYKKELDINERLIEKLNSYKDYVFCPMQCFWDANFNPEFNWSPFTGKKAMNEFIDFVQNKYPNDTIIFRCHPADMGRFEEYSRSIKNGNSLIPGFWDNDFRKTERDLIKQFIGAKQVVGINSTCLLQSVLFEIPTEALGFGYIQAADKLQENRMKMVTATRMISFKHNNQKECNRVMELVHKKGEVCWK